MCGIWGMAGHLALDAPRLMAITKKLSHRGPDDEGICLFDTERGHLLAEKSAVQRYCLGTAADRSGKRLVLANTRLSILDLSADGHQPMADSAKRVWIAFNGEIYNYVELREALQGLGHVFRTRTDTEVLLTAYLEWGNECVKRLNGMWAFAIWDSRRHELFCSIDHFGIKPFYFATSSRGFAFASEPRALFATEIVSPVPNETSVFRYLVHNEPPVRGESFYKEVSQLAGGEYLTVSLGGSAPSVKRGTWWKPSAVSGSSPGTAEELRALVLDSVRIRLRSDVKVGACLSGGLDSSLIVACMRELEPQSDLSTFTAVFPGDSRDESKWARIASESFRTRHHEIRSNGTGLVHDIDHLVTAQGEPFHGLTVYAQYRVMQEARAAGVKVLLDGQGSDEIFLGYHWHMAAHLARLLAQGRLTSAFGLSRDVAMNRVDLPLHRLLALLLLFRLPVVRNSRNEWRAKQGINPDFLSKWRTRIKGRVGTENLSSRAQEITDTVLPTLLRYEDRNSMAFSLEARLPFLDHRLVEFSLGIPDELLLRNGISKALLRDAAAALLPKTLNDRLDKVGFAVPDRDWLGQIRNYAIDRLSSSSVSAAYIDRDALKLSFSAESSDPQWVWRALNLHLWMDLTCATS